MIGLGFAVAFDLVAEEESFQKEIAQFSYEIEETIENLKSVGIGFPPGFDFKSAALETAAIKRTSGMKKSERAGLILCLWSELIERKGTPRNLVGGVEG